MAGGIDMENMKTLYRLEQGQKGRIVKLLSVGSIRRRLMDLGITEGAEIECAYTSPTKNPVAYRIRGALIALRLEDAIDILVLPESLYEKEECVAAEMVDDRNRIEKIY